MDEGKILIVNLSRGLMGEDNAAILGAMMVTKIQLAAMGRADLPEAQRRPFYMYVDEFQNFATDSFAVILSEARKYGLNLTVANQYISQMSEPVRDAVFGNVGTILCFRISPDDAPLLEKYFTPQFEAGDLIQQHSRYFVATMMISDEKAPAFSAKTLNLPQTPADSTAQIIELSRSRYTQDRQVVEGIVRQASGLAIDVPNQQQKPSHPPGMRPKTQAQVQQVSKTPPSQQDANKMGSGVLKSVLSNPYKTNRPVSGSTEPHKKRRRRSRKKKTSSHHQPSGAPTNPRSDSGTLKPNSDVDDLVVKIR